MILGVIADDFTGASDLANNLVCSGMRVVQLIGIPSTPLPSQFDAAVIALKSRTIPPAEAVAQSLAAMRWLLAQGAQQIYFKYCSTFDSTAEGNIGPVTEALMDALEVPFTIATPAFPDNARTVFKGHLFVGDLLLHESSMKSHPLTPMTDPNLVRVMQAQTKRTVGLIDYRVVAQGSSAIRAQIAQLMQQGIQIAIVDAVSNEDLMRLGAALKDHRLVTGGSGVALGLPANWNIAPTSFASQLPAAKGWRAIIAGSCSQATNRQVAAFKATGAAALALDPVELLDPTKNMVAKAIDWARPRLMQGPVLIYSSAEPEAVKSVQARLGVNQAGALVEQTLANLAVALVQNGVGQLIVAGGETSGACVQALGLLQLQIGPQIDPGVPWCYASHTTGALHIALKSGNFGGDDFFTHAFTYLE